MTAQVVHGINEHPVWFDTSGHSDWFDYAEAAHISSVRIDLIWSSLETAKGQYSGTYQGRCDNFIDEAYSRGMSVCALISNCPPWANGSQSSITPPTDYTDYADFCAYCADRYAGKVSAYQIWNEPHGGWAWAGGGGLNGGATGSEYVPLLQEAYTAIKAVDSGLTVVGINLANTAGRPPTFMHECFTAGAIGYYDVIGQHVYYEKEYPPWTDPPAAASTEMAEWEANILSLMSSHGEGSREVWLTEIGHSTETGGYCDEDHQATTLTDWYTEVEDYYPQIKRLYWYTFNNTGTSSTNAEHNYGICHTTNGQTPPSKPWTMKPAYDAYAELDTNEGVTDKSGTESGTGTDAGQRGPIPGDLYLERR